MSKTKRTLVTDASGTGKSTLERLFSQKGYLTEDIDYGFAYWQDKSTGQKVEEERDNPDWLARVRWALDYEKLLRRLELAGDEPILVFGSTNDLGEHLDLFDRVFLLEYQGEDQIIQRITGRPEGGYGKHSHELDSLLSYYVGYQEQMKNLGATVIDCNLDLGEITKIIEA